MAQRKLIHKVVGRLAAWGLFNHMADEEYIKLVYWARMGKKLNLDNPKTFNEKIQWLKLYDRNPEYTKMVDKYEAKNYVASIIGDEYIIPTLGVWDKFEDIDFDSLPNKFVLKCTHDSGGIVICRDKSKLNYLEAENKINKSLNTNFYMHSREWPYKNVKPRIVAEKYMEDSTEDYSDSPQMKVCGLTDYKFYCFNGIVKYLYVSKGLEDHSTARISFLSPDWKKMDFKRSDYSPFVELPHKPHNFEKMKRIAEILSEHTDFLRVDLYEIDNQIYFSELTFSPCGGYMPFDPPEYDEIVGNDLLLSNF